MASFALGLETHQVSATAMMSPQGFTGSPYLPENNNDDNIIYKKATSGQGFPHGYGVWLLVLVYNSWSCKCPTSFKLILA